MKIAYFFCIDTSKDRVGPAAYKACMAIHQPKQTGIVCDGQPILESEDGSGNRFAFIATEEVVSHDFARYAPLLNGPFSDYDLAGIVNWHEGANAPDSIFCVHTTGDVPSGIFGPADPILTTAALIALERTRNEFGLDGWGVLPEATHFSGIAYGCSPSDIRLSEVPVIDIEIGSTSVSWQNALAIEVLAKALVRLPEAITSDAIPLLFVGGVHFEPSLANAIIAPGSPPYAFGHVLPNQWLNPDRYQGEYGARTLMAAIESTRGPVKTLAFHEGLKGPVKDAVRMLGSELGIPVLKHKRLRDAITPTIR